MKEKLSSVFYMWVAFALGAIAVLFMLTPVLVDENANYVSATSVFWNNGLHNGAWPAFIGYMLILVGSLASAIIALPIIQPSAKVEKIVLISSIAAMVIGLVAVGLLQIEYSGFNKGVDFSLDKLHYLWGWYVSMFAGLAAIAMDVVALKLDW